MSRSARVDRWRWPTFCGGLFVVALAWRLAYLARLGRTPLADSLAADAGIYWDWAGYLLSHGPLGTHPFFLGPLYPYVLALLRAVLGDQPSAVLVVQAIWGSAAVVLLADATRRVAGFASGAVVGVALCFYEMAVFFDGLILMESLLFFLEACLLWLVARIPWKTTPLPAWLGVGALIGLLAEGRATAALLGIVAAIVLIPEIAVPRRGKALAALAAGFLVITVPIAFRNTTVSGEFIPFTYNFGYNLYVGNHPDAHGASAPIAGTNLSEPYGLVDGGGEIDGRGYLRFVEGRPLSPGESSRYWAARAADFAREHPGRTATLAFVKLGMFWNRREYAQVENVREHRAAAGPLGLPFIGTFAFLGVLGLTGAWFAARQGVAGRFALGYVIALSIAVMPFFVTDRYRLHLIPGVAILAGVALHHLLELRHRPRTEVLRFFAILVVAIVVVFLPAPHLGRAASEWTVARDRGERLLAVGRPAEAAAAFERALRLESEDRVDLGGAMATAIGSAQLRMSAASALRRIGRRADAIPLLEHAMRLAPDDPFIARALADGYWSQGRRPEADSVYARLDSLPGGAGLSEASRGWQAAHGGNRSEAEAWFRAAIQQAPRLHEALGALVRLQTESGQLDSAFATLNRARRAGMPNADYHAHAALVLSARGEWEAALEELRKVPAGAAQDPILEDVIGVARAQIEAAPP